MREERGQIAGDVTVSDEMELWGNVGGDVTVANGGKFYLRGAIYGNLSVEPGGRVHIFGQVKGDVTIHKKTKLVHSGVIGGDLINDGGRLYVDRTAKVGGKVKTKSGQTRFEGNQPPKPLES
jgi:cytoskeletal protein CcmA (bactofilin family)